MNPSLSAYRSTPTPPSRIHRLEVAMLDLMIVTVEKIQPSSQAGSVRLAKGAGKVWKRYDRLPVAKQLALLAALGMICFFLGLVNGAL